MQQQLMTPATLEEQSFLTAILADGRDTVARLVFADWLDEHDRSTQAETLRAWGDITWSYDSGRHCLDGVTWHLAEVSDEERGYCWHTILPYYSDYCTTLEAAKRCAYHVLILTLLATKPCAFITYDTGDAILTEVSDHMTLTFPDRSRIASLHYATHQAVMRMHVSPYAV